MAVNAVDISLNTCTANAQAIQEAYTSKISVYYSKPATHSHSPCKYWRCLLRTHQWKNAMR